ncbi:MAG: enoyl-CoA hydratase/isomerase family protein [Alphaproteobacteria bacterium]|nr:enoyl-CoA hydratase/isomerase family protein [Alphaproteobacteria bacterium]
MHSKSAAPAAPEIVFERRGRLGVVTLDRPKALNALTLGMIRELDPMLRQWAHDHGVQAVVIRGAGEKAFCAGGDVRAVYEAGRRGTDVLTYEFFFEEYRLNRRINRFTKPYIALLDGIAMGGGLGLSVHGRYRVVTERATVAMPESAIGLFPDVGGSWFLDRAPGKVGAYLGLTGARVKGADIIYAGLATHYVPSADLPALLEALSHTPPEAALHRFAQDPGPAPLAAHRAQIDRAFAPPTASGIIAALGKEGAWGQALAADLAKKSPTSLCATLRLLQRHHRHEIEDCLKGEFRLVQRFMAGHDFYEGIRAVLIDKDHAPKWNPASIEAVDPAAIDAMFEPLESGELTFED